MFSRDPQAFRRSWNNVNHVINQSESIDHSAIYGFLVVDSDRSRWLTVCPRIISDSSAADGGHNSISHELMVNSVGLPSRSYIYIYIYMMPPQWP